MTVDMGAVKLLEHRLDRTTLDRVATAVRQELEQIEPIGKGAPDDDEGRERIVVPAESVQRPQSSQTGDASADAVIQEATETHLKVAEILTSLDEERRKSNQQVRELSIIGKVGQAIVAYLDLQKLLQATLEEACERGLAAARRSSVRACALISGDARHLRGVLELAGDEPSVERDARWLADELGAQATDPAAVDEVNFGRAELLHQVMVRNGDGNKKCIITEGGWNDHPRWTKAVRPGQRIEYTIRAYEKVLKEWDWCEGVAFWAFRYPRPARTYQDYYTFVAIDFTPKPIYWEVQQYARGER